MLFGDFNLHHPLWSHDDTVPSPRAQSLVDWAEDQGLSLLNETGESTFERGGSSSVLDLTFISDSLTARVKEWSVRYGLDFSSDHLPITWCLTHSPDHFVPLGERFVFDDENLEKWGEAFERLLPPAARPTLPPRFGSDELKQRIDDLLHAILTASRETCLRPPSRTAAYPWFTKEVRQALNAVRRARSIHLKATSTACTEAFLIGERT